MVWDANKPAGNESLKCFHRVLPFMCGTGLDLGCGSRKVHPGAIGIDTVGGDIQLDVTELPMFKNESMDYVFSSHCLEDIVDTEATLIEWWRVLKCGGYMVLYLPHKELYPNVGQVGANENHFHDFMPDDILKIMEKNFAFRLIRNDTHAEGDEYSFELVVQKMAGKKPKKVVEILTTPENACMVIRYGAYGDNIQASSVIKRLKEEGYYVIVQTSYRGKDIYQNNPNIDRLEEIPSNSLTGETQAMYWGRLAKLYKKFVNLSGIVEQLLLKIKHQPGYDMPAGIRRQICNFNYLDMMHIEAGYDDWGGYKPEMFFSAAEEIWAEKTLKPFKDKFVVLWSWHGSGWNKRYPWGQLVQETFCKQHPDAIIITVGDELCRLLDYDNPQVKHMAGKTNIRQSCLLTKYVDLVVGPETGILNAASCYDTPKIVLMSHSSEENLTKYWENVTPLKPDCKCSPCHRLVYHYTECHNDLTRKIPGDVLIKHIEAANALTDAKTEVTNDTLIRLNSDISKACDCMVHQPYDRVVEAMNYWYERKKVRYAA